MQASANGGLMMHVAAVWANLIAVCAQLRSVRVHVASVVAVINVWASEGVVYGAKRVPSASVLLYTQANTSLVCAASGSTRWDHQAPLLLLHSLYQQRQRQQPKPQPQH